MPERRHTPPTDAARAGPLRRWLAGVAACLGSSKLRRANADLERRYREVYEHATEGIFRTTPDGRMLAANPALVRMAGDGSEAELLARVTDINHQSYVDPSRRAHLLRLLGEHGKVEQFEAEWIIRDGSRIWVSMNARVERDASGQVLYIEGTARDITRQKRMEAELALSTAEARKLALVLRRTHNPVVITDATGHVEWTNEAFAQMTGYTQAELIGCVPTELLGGPSADPAAMEQIRQRVAAGEPFELEARRFTKAGRPFWLSVDAEPVRDDGGRVRQFVAIAEDVTDRKRSQWLEQDRRQLLERVARHQPVESTLASVCESVARQWDGARAAVLRYDGGPGEADQCYETPDPPSIDRRWVAAAPNLSATFVATVDATLALADHLGPFAPGDATAPVETTVTDVSTDPRWAPLAAIAAAERIVACRSVPIVGGDGSLLGELAVLLSPDAVAATGDEMFRRAIGSLAGLSALAIEHQRLTDRLACQATHDPLTGLPNRARLDAVLPGWLASAARAGRPLGVLMIDLDGFKHVNDTLGHGAGDELLVQVASRLQAAARVGDVLARMGGDEFTLIATDLAGARDIAVVANRMLAALAPPFAVDGRELFVTASVGTAAFPTDGADGVALVRNADAAMYAAKGAGRNRSAGFDPSMNAAARERLDLEGRLRRVTATLIARGTCDGELSLAYQPQVEADGRVRGVEALLRWDNPRLGRVPPNKFIPIAEASGLIVPIGTWVLREACRQAAAWRAAGCGPVVVAVNVSVVQFAQPDFVAVVTAALNDHGLHPETLELELTESVLMANTTDAVEKLTAVRQLGVATAIDDFGTGYSSLAYLRKLPIDQLKIDQSFVRDLNLDGVGGAIDGPASPATHTDNAVLTAIAGLAATLGMETVAEGVETSAQRDYLIRLGCRVFQGYLYSRPLAADRIEPVLRAGRVEIGTPAIAAAA